MRIALTLVVLVALAAGGLYLSDPVFWDRYFHAYTFESFVENPFPTLERQYPQEVVEGVPEPRRLPRATGAMRSIDPAALEEAARFAEATDSTSLIVYHDGRIQLERYWLGARPDRPVYSFSMHKSVLALCIGIAIDEGAIEGVDDPLGEYLEAWQDDPRGEITIEHALWMASGLEPMLFPKNPFSKHVHRQIGTDLAETALGFELYEEPGTVFRYNGVNPTLLLMVLEQATGERYAHYLSERLWKPLGNHDAAVWLDAEDGLARGATSLFAVPMDWLRVGLVVMNGGRVSGRQVVPGDWLEAMTTPSPTNPLYGYLTWIGVQEPGDRELESFTGFAAETEEPFVAPDVVFFDGLGGQRVYIIPSRSMIIVRTGVLAREWDDTILPNTLMRGIRRGPGAAGASPAPSTQTAGEETS